MIKYFMQHRIKFKKCLKQIKNYRKDNHNFILIMIFITTILIYDTMTLYLSFLKK